MADVVTPADAVRAATDLPYASAPEVRTGSGFQGNAGETFQFGAEPESPGAGPVR